MKITNKDEIIMENILYKFIDFINIVSNFSKEHNIEKKTYNPFYNIIFVMIQKYKMNIDYFDNFDKEILQSYYDLINILILKINKEQLTEIEIEKNNIFLENLKKALNNIEKNKNKTSIKVKGSNMIN